LPVISPLIHVVDDDPAVTRALRRLLHAWGMQVCTFASGEEFLSAMAGSHIPDCSVVDVHMPGMNGLEVQARMAGAKMDVPLIFMTAHDEAGVEEQALKGGAVGFLRKPFSDEALVELIRIGLRHRREPAAGGAEPGE